MTAHRCPLRPIGRAGSNTAASGANWLTDGPCRWLPTARCADDGNLPFGVRMHLPTRGLAVPCVRDPEDPCVRRPASVPEEADGEHSSATKPLVERAVRAAPERRSSGVRTHVAARMTLRTEFLALGCKLCVA